MTNSATTHAVPETEAPGTSEGTESTKRPTWRDRLLLRRRPKPDPVVLGDHVKPLMPEAVLAAADAMPCGPDDVTLAPAPSTPRAALEACGELAVLDTRHPGADRFSGPVKPVQPSVDTIAVSSRTPLDRLGERWFRAKYLYETGVLGKIDPEPVTWKNVIGKTAPLVLLFVVLCGAGIINELIYGKKATSLLTSASDGTATFAAVSISLLFSAAGFVIAHLIYSRRPEIVHDHGVAIGLALIAGIILVVLGLGAVVAGFDAIAATGLDGGGQTSRTSTGADHRIMLGATYAGLFIITTFAIAAGHLLLAHEAHEARLKAIIKSQDDAAEASLDANERTSLMIEITNAHVDAIPAAHHEGARRMGAYNAAWSRNVDAETNEMFDRLVYVEVEPTWKQEAIAYRNHLTDVHNTDTTHQRPHLRLA